MKQHVKVRVERFRDEYNQDILDDVYSEEEIEHLLEDDEISSEEEAFMRGYIEDS